MSGGDLIALAERCEAADGPNYALEVEIFKAIHPEYAGYVQGRGGLVHPCDGSDVRVLSDVRPGNYTASLDAAMTLVGGDFWRVEDHELAGPCALVGDQEGYAETPALALCAAALRARATFPASSRPVPKAEAQHPARVEAVAGEKGGLL